MTKQESNYISSAARASLTRSSVWHSYIHIAVHINLYKPIHIRICVYIYIHMYGSGVGELAVSHAYSEPQSSRPVCPSSNTH